MKLYQLSVCPAQSNKGHQKENRKGEGEKKSSGLLEKATTTTNSYQQETPSPKFEIVLQVLNLAYRFNLMEVPF